MPPLLLERSEKKNYLFVIFSKKCFSFLASNSILSLIVPVTFVFEGRLFVEATFFFLDRAQCPAVTQKNTLRFPDCQTPFNPTLNFS